MHCAITTQPLAPPPCYDTPTEPCLPCACSARGWLWVVFDNLHALGRVDEHFQFRSPDNRLVGVMGEDSQFEVRRVRGFPGEPCGLAEIPMEAGSRQAGRQAGLCPLF